MDTIEQTRWPMKYYLPRLSQNGLLALLEFSRDYVDPESAVFYAWLTQLLIDEYKRRESAESDAPVDVELPDAFPLTQWSGQDLGTAFTLMHSLSYAISDTTAGEFVDCLLRYMVVEIVGRLNKMDERTEREK